MIREGTETQTVGEKSTLGNDRLRYFFTDQYDLGIVSAGGVGPCRSEDVVPAESDGAGATR